MFYSIHMPTACLQGPAIVIFPNPEEHYHRSYAVLAQQASLQKDSLLYVSINQAVNKSAARANTALSSVSRLPLLYVCLSVCQAALQCVMSVFIGVYAI